MILASNISEKKPYLNNPSGSTPMSNAHIIVSLFSCVIALIILLILSVRARLKLQARMKEKDREIKQLSLVLNEKMSNVAIDLGNIAETLQKKRDEIEAILCNTRRSLPRGEEE